MADVLSSLRAPDGSVTIAGLHDDVQELPPAVRESWTALPFDAAAFLGGVGLSVPAGERDRPVLEQVWARPCFEVHGLGSGYLGEGFKSVIPAVAHAKVSFRLCPAGIQRASIRPSASMSSPGCPPIAGRRSPRSAQPHLWRCRLTG